MAARSWEPDPVLVGVDGSEESTRAVRWAAREARLRGAGLHVLHAWLWPLFRVPLSGSPMVAPGAGLQAEADRVLAAAAATAQAVAPDLVVETTLAVGDPGTELVRRAAGAQLVVVGSRGLGGFTGLLLGSTGIALSAHSPRPVAVVRGNEAAHGPIVVGVDGSASADNVLRRAFHEAALHHAQVLVVHSWSVGLTHFPLADEAHERVRRTAREQAEERVDKALSRVTADFDEIEVTVRLGEASAAADLVSASGEARLVVVGARDLGSLRGMLLGSTTHAVLHHAVCPVLVQR